MSELELIREFSDSFHAEKTTEPPVLVRQELYRQITGKTLQADRSVKSLKQEVTVMTASADAEEHLQFAHSYTPCEEDEYTGEEENPKFTIGRKIGVGGFGEVYEATLPNGQTAAVKYLNKEEEIVGKELDHPNIIQTLFTGDDENGKKYVVQEYVKGKNLMEIIEQHPEGLPYDDFLRIAYPVVRAVEYLHNKGIIHGDIKPQNILVPDNSEEEVKITDFGLSRKLEEQLIQSMHTTQTFQGTLKYAAPEQIRKGQKPTKESDVYSLATVLFEMMCGKDNIPLEMEEQDHETPTWNKFTTDNLCHSVEFHTKGCHVFTHASDLWNCMRQTPAERYDIEFMIKLFDKPVQKEQSEYLSTIWNFIEPYVKTPHVKTQTKKVTKSIDEKIKDEIIEEEKTDKSFAVSLFLERAGDEVFKWLPGYYINREYGVLLEVLALVPISIGFATALQYPVLAPLSIAAGLAMRRLWGWTAFD